MDNQIKLLSDLLGESEFSLVDHYLRLLAKNNSVEQTVRNLQEKFNKNEKLFNEEKKQYLQEIELLKQKALDDEKKQGNEIKNRIVSNKYNDLNNRDLDHDLSKGVWIDPETNLMWSRISIGQKWKNEKCSCYAKTLTLDDAKKACQSFGLADFDDWRLPNIDELKSLTDQDKKKYHHDKKILFSPNSKKLGSYWSSKNAGNNRYFYFNFCNFQSGYDFPRNFHYVRAVRGPVRN